MYVLVLPDNIRQKCLSMKCRYVHVLHVYCLYLVGMCRYGILCTLKFVMTVPWAAFIMMTMTTSIEDHLQLSALPLISAGMDALLVI